MNFIHKILVMAAIIILGISCLIAGTYYGTRVTVNMRPKETETERTLRTTTIKPYEPPSSCFYREKNIGEESPIEKETTLEIRRTTTLRNKITTCGTSKFTSKPTSKFTSKPTSKVTCESTSKEETTILEETISADLTEQLKTEIEGQE